MKHWSYKGFTIIEVFLALSLTSILVVMSARGFLRAKAASRADIFVQEASLIRGAILRYKEEIDGGHDFARGMYRPWRITSGSTGI